MIVIFTASDSLDFLATASLSNQMFNKTRINIDLLLIIIKANVQYELGKKCATM